MKPRLTLLALAASLLLPAAAGAQPSPDRALRSFLQRQFGADQENNPDTRYAAASADLNGDGRAETLVYLMSGNACGSGGCTLYVFTPRGRSWRRVAAISVANQPIRLLATRSRGWRDLGIAVGGGGIPRGYEALVPFNGRAYASNPTVAPARRLRGRIPGRVLIAANDRGRPLFRDND